jgi:hypothetical protein
MQYVQAVVPGGAAGGGGVDEEAIGLGGRGIRIVLEEQIKYRSFEKIHNSQNI